MLIRPFEIGVYASVLVLAGLLFLKSRPAALVWISALTMATLGAHLYLEHGRWQLVPVYLLVFALSIVLAIPSRRRYRTGGLVLRICMVVLLVLPSIGLAIAVPIFRVPPPSGDYPVGSVSLSLPGSVRARVWYPAEPGAGVYAPYWERDDIVTHNLPGYPRLFSSHLALVPGNAFVRAGRADTVMPVLLAFVAEDALPSDYLTFFEQAASLGWFVAELPANAQPDEIAEFINSVADGTIDTAFAASLDPNRTIAVGLGVEPPAGFGLPAIRIGGDTLFSVETSAATYGIDAPDLVIPPAALSNRYLIVRPSRILVGGSEIAPRDLNHLLVTAFSAVIGGGDLSTPVFIGTSLAGALGTVRTMFADIQGISVSPRPR